MLNVRRPHGILYCTLIAAVLAAYAPLLMADFAWDDEFLVKGLAANHWGWTQPFYQNLWDGLQPADQASYSGFYRPLALLDFLVLLRISGPRPMVFHAVSLLAHLACGAALFTLLVRHLRAQQRDRPTMTGTAFFDPTLPAILTTGLFLLHPAQQEAVAFVAARNDLWATLAVLLTMLAWNSRVWPLAGVTLLAGLLCKESGAVAIPMILGLDLMDHRAGGPARRAWRYLVLPCALAVYLLLRSGLGHVSSSRPEIPSVSMIVAFFGHYATLFLGMESPCAYHPVEALPMTPWVVAALIGVGVLSVGTSLMGGWLGWGGAFLALAMPLTIVLFTGNLADRYFYLPLAMICLGLAPAISRISTRRMTTGVMLLVLLLALAGNAHSIWRWHDSASLFQHGVTCDPTPRSSHLLGNALVARGDFDGAMEAYRRGAYFEKPNLSSIVQLGALLLRSGHVAEGLAELDRAPALGLEQTADWSFNRAACLRLLGRFPDAQTELRRLRALDSPDNPRSVLSLAAVATLQGDWSQGEEWLADKQLSMLDPVERRARVDAIVQETKRFRESTSHP